jgi:sterol desaturase/sphingolipid hydroxylase (fatty acid hydroxylase superfamily)
MPFSPHALETWMPLFAVFLAALSWGLHRLKHTPTGMSGGETLSNVATFLVWRFVFFAGGIALQFAVFSWIANQVPWKLNDSPGVYLAAVLAADFCYYWKHRGEHDLSLLWAQHSVHHSSGEYNLSTSLRLPWLGSYLNWPFFIPALLVGFSAKQIILGHQVVLAYQYLVHTEYVGRLGGLEKILNTPSHHRVHHGSNPEYLDKNYGGILILWDKLFGSFREESFHPRYGTVLPMESKNPFVINGRPWVELWGHVKKRRGFLARARVLITAPRNV